MDPIAPRYSVLQIDIQKPNLVWLNSTKDLTLAPVRFTRIVASAKPQLGATRVLRIVASSFQLNLNILSTSSASSTSRVSIWTHSGHRMELGEASEVLDMHWSIVPNTALPCNSRTKASGEFGEYARTGMLCALAVSTSTNFC